MYYYHIQIPQMPILGPYSFQQVIQFIYEAIVGEATAIDFYSRLVKEAPNDLHREFIQDAHDDEMKHLYAFTRLYCYLTGQMPQYVITPTIYSNYKEGLQTALKDELKAAGFYRNIQLSIMDLLIKDTFYYAMVDELEHATMFSTLYNSI